MQVEEEEFCRRCTLMHADAIRTNELSERIIGCALRANNNLGVGVLEKIYENALRMTCARRGFPLSLAIKTWMPGLRPA